jgi:hypothetical protein
MAPSEDYHFDKPANTIVLTTTTKMMIYFFYLEQKVVATIISYQIYGLFRQI